MFDVYHDQIVVVSETAQVYKIAATFLKQSDSGNPYLEYTVTAADGKKAIITYLQMIEKSKPLNTQVVINDYQNPMTVLEGAVKKVF